MLTLQDGLISRQISFQNPTEALHAAGLRNEAISTKRATSEAGRLPSREGSPASGLCGRAQAREKVRERNKKPDQGTAPPDQTQQLPRLAPL
jgi:hypothetical protein